MAETYNDKYVVVYRYADVDYDVACKEFHQLLDDVEAVGLDTEVRPGYDQSLLVFVKVPKDLLGNTVYKSRVKDFLYGVVSDRPDGDKKTVVKGDFEAEDLLSVYHLVQWQKENGGAGITPGSGQWEHVTSIFPMHNEKRNQALLRHLSRKFVLQPSDLDEIRDLFGTKVSFYFAFIQTYLMFLSLPAIGGLFAWLWLPNYSLFYAIFISVWCTVFLEYWKTREIDLSLRWNVRGVGHVKVNRPEFKYEKIIINSDGTETRFFPKWKQITRQLLQFPFLLVATLVLGVLIGAVFAIEILISETYEGPYEFYLNYVPTILLAVAIPFITSSLEGIASWMTHYENHRTADLFDMALTQKIFALNIITNYLPIFLTAFVYVPFGGKVIPRLEGILNYVLGRNHGFTIRAFQADPNRLRNEVITLTVTGQVFSFMEENILPLVKHKAKELHRDFRRVYSKDVSLLSMVPDHPGEVEFLRRARNEATLPEYNVQDDIAELVLQFGYLSLFSPAWPLIPLGFFINNWIELRSDFVKICIEHQRPAPVRADGIGSWIISLEILTWVGSISTAAIVHLFGTDTHGGGQWSTLPITIFISEHVLLSLRAIARWMFDRYGSDEVRKDRKKQYAARTKVLEEIEANKRAGLSLTVTERERRKTMLKEENDPFWIRQVEDGASAREGLSLIKQHYEGKGEKTE